MIFINNLKAELKKRGITKTELARDLEIPESSIRNWEKGSQPSLDKAIKISKYLNISLDKLCNINAENNDKIREAYEQADEGTKAAVRKLLDISEENEENLSISEVG